MCCPLPGAFRRLPRLSSPVVAKAFTVCACSLDPLTPTPGVSDRHFRRHFIFFPEDDFLHSCWMPKAIRHVTATKRMLRSGYAPSILLKSGLTRPPYLGSGVRRWLGRVEFWWSQAGSNRRPPACKADALPVELWPPHRYWWVWMDSNHRPHPYQGCALTT